MTGKEKCEMLKSIRKQIAEANDIKYIEPECHNEKYCQGTCPQCDAQIRYLDKEISRKVANGESITISSISVDPFEKIIERADDIFFEEVCDLPPDCGVMLDMDDAIRAERERIDNIPIEDLDLSEHTYKVLKCADLTRVGKLRGNMDVIAPIGMLGRKGILEVKEKLKALGIR